MSARRRLEDNGRARGAAGRDRQNVSATIGIGAVHDLDGVAGLHQICSRLQCGQRGGRGRAGVIIIADDRTYIVCGHFVTQMARRLGGVENIRLAETRQRLLQRLDTERSAHRVRQLPRHHRPACTVHDRYRIEKAASAGGFETCPFSMRSLRGDQPQRLALERYAGRQP